MPVIGVSLNKIMAEKIKPITSMVEVRSDTNIKNVKEFDLNEFNRKGLNISFDFIISYVKDKKEKLGEIMISGDVLYLDPDKQDSIIKEWNETKKLPSKVNIEVLNSVLRRSIIKSMGISEDLQLPPPIGIPQATEKTPGVPKEWIGEQL